MWWACKCSEGIVREGCVRTTSCVSCVWIGWSGTVCAISLASVCLSMWSCLYSVDTVQVCTYISPGRLPPHCGEQSAVSSTLCDAVTLKWLMYMW